MTASSHLPAPKVRPRIAAAADTVVSGIQAAARKLTGGGGRKADGGGDGRSSAAWGYYDAVGELHYAANHVARSAARARLFVGRKHADADDPVPVEPGTSLLDPWVELGPTDVQRRAMLHRFVLSMFVAGECWVAGVPRWRIVDPDRDPGDLTAPDRTMEWMVLSADEVTVARDGTTTLRTPDGNVEVGADESGDHPDDVRLAHVWQPHPHNHARPDSGTLSALSALEEIVGLTAHLRATVRSRLAGAGLLIVPDGSRPVGTGTDEGDTADGSDDADLVDALIDVATVPLSDPDSAAAVVPLVMSVPTGSDPVQYLTFSTPMDAAASDNRDRAIRRLALSLDVPPEALLGMTDANHWSAWQISDDTVQSTIEPALALFCDALTVVMLWPSLPAPDPSLTVWYDASPIVHRPNRTADAVSLFDRGAIGVDALVREAGFDVADQPAAAEGESTRAQAVSRALDLVAAAPSLAQQPGLVALADAIEELLDTVADGGGPGPAQPSDVAPADPDDGPTPPTS